MSTHKGNEYVLFDAYTCRKKTHHRKNELPQIETQTQPPLQASKDEEACVPPCKPTLRGEQAQAVSLAQVRATAQVPCLGT